jgi:phosphoglycerate kinase
MIRLKSLLPIMPVAGKRVIVRVDYNVPLADGHIACDLRLRATLPTIQTILDKDGKVILLTHMGRPHEFDPKLSTQILLPWFEQQGFSIEFASDLQAAYQKSLHSTANIIMVENLRFFPGEKAHSAAFAQELERLGDAYVDDAFALIHEADTSMTLLAELFPMEKRSIGLLMEHEITTLNKLIENPKKPFVLIVGGNKIEEKTALIRNLAKHSDTILLCPAIVFSYLRSLGKNVGSSLIDETSIELWNNLSTTATQNEVKIVTPIDYLVAKNDLRGELRVIKADGFQHDDVGITIGPETTKLYCQTIKYAQTALYNGLTGIIERPETLQATKEIFNAMATVHTSIIGGGDSTAAVELLHIERGTLQLCTGGGAMIAYLAGQDLPGLQPFLR